MGEAEQRETLAGCLPPQATCVTGPSWPALAEAARAAVERLLEQGAAPQDLYVVAANRNMQDALVRAGLPWSVAALTFDEAARMVRRRAEQASGAPAQEGSPAAQAGGASAQGPARPGRVLLPPEEKVLLEDMKVSGLKVRRLREELGFLFRGLTEGLDEDPAWLVNDEERSLLAFLRDHLAERGAVLACERGSLALRCLRDEGARAALARPHVVALGFSSLDRCGQMAVARLASSSLVALGSELDFGVREIAYPWPEGMRELAEAGARVESLPGGRAGAPAGVPAGAPVGAPAAARPAAPAGPAEAAGAPASTPGSARLVASRLAARVRADDAMARGREARPIAPAGPGDAPISLAATPQAEFAEAARIAAGWVADGTPADEVLVVAPNAAYAAGIARELERAGVPCSAAARPPFAGGDPRKEGGSGAARFLAGLGILADPRDVASWRSWLGFGDWLLRSDAWETLRAIAGQRGEGLADALDDLRACLRPGSGVELAPQARPALKLADALAEGDALRAACAGLRGAALVEELSRRAGWAPGEAEARVLAAAPADDAAGLLEAARTAMLDGSCPRAGVAVAVPERAYGSAARRVLLSGMVDGYLPCHAACDENDTLDRQARNGRRERRRLLALVAMAADEVAFTAFSETDVETAERSHAEMGRIFVRGGERRATAVPSSFLWECRADRL